MAQLKPCPFCGGEAKVANALAYLDNAKLVACKTCGCKTRFFLINHPSINFDGSIIESTRYTEDQAVNKAIEAWNVRV